MSEGKEKMKKKFKKTILGTLFVALLLVLPFVNKGGIEKVKAEPNCHTHTNYYFYSLVASYDSYRNGKFPLQRVHTSYFSDELPEGAVIESAQYNWLDLGAGEDGWTISKFWTTDITIDDDDKTPEGAPKPKKNGDEWYFAHALAWVDDATGEEREDNVEPTQYATSDLVRNSFYAQSSDGIMALRIQDSANNLIIGSVKRLIDSDWIAFADKVKAQANGTEHPTDGQIWIPSLLQVTFDVCEDEPEPEPEPDPEYNVIVKYVDDETNQEIKNQKDLGSFKTGEDYATTCDDTIGDYELVSEKELSGTMANSDVTLYCRYRQPEPEPEPEPDPTFDLTINYLDKNTREPIKDPYHDPNAYSTGDKYTAECLDSVGNSYILDSYTGNLSGTFANKDIVINCLYTTQPVQTSDIPIFIVWAVGGAGLIYSIYYFRRYYKKQSSV